MERENFNKRNCFQRDAKSSLSLLISFMKSNKGDLNFVICAFLIIIMQLIRFSVNEETGRSQSTRKWHNSGIINPLLKGLTYMCRHFAQCSFFSSPLWGLEKCYATCKISMCNVC